MLGRTIHAIHYDEIHDEIVVPNPFAQAILTFRGGADGEEAPIRVIQGDRTRLRNSSGVVLDPVNNEIYSGGLVFDRHANGNVAPIRTLDFSVDAVDPVHDLLIAVDSTGRGRLNLKMSIYDRKAVGKAKPLRVIVGPSSMLANVKRVRVYGEWILVVRDGFEAPGPQDGRSFVAVWSIYDEGDVPPRWTIGGPNGMLERPRGLDVDPKNRTVMVSDKGLNAALTFYVPELF